MCTSASIGSSFRSLKCLRHQDVDAPSDRAADSRSVDDASRRRLPVDRAHRRTGQPVQALSGCWPRQSPAEMSAPELQTSGRLRLFVYPRLWQYGQNGIGIRNVAIGSRMKSVCSAWRVDEGWQLAANTMLPESSNHIDVDDVVIGGIRGIRGLSPVAWWAFDGFSMPSRRPRSRRLSHY